MSRIYLLQSVLLLMILANTAMASSQVTRSVVAAGGAEIQGASHTVTGTLGQPAVGVVSSSSFEIRTGFWTQSASLLRVPSQYAHIQTAIDAASPGDTILVAPGTYTHASDKNLDFGGKNLALISEGGQTLTIIDCLGVGRGMVFNTDEDSTSIVDGFTIMNGNETNGGGILLIGAEPKIRNCIVKNCTAMTGGGLYTWAGDVPPSELEDLFIDNCDFIDNTANEGGGLYLNLSHVKLRLCTVRGNTANTNGGGIRFLNGWGAELADCVIDSNQANGASVGNGGGIDLGYGSPLISRCTIADNQAVKNGGGIEVFWSDATIDNCVIERNVANEGGGIDYVADMGSSVIGCVVRGNSAVRGGGVSIGGVSRPNLVDTEIIANTASSRGGGVHDNRSLGNGESPTLTRCRIAGNTSASFGGGVDSDLGGMSLIDCEITGNLAIWGGGLNQQGSLGSAPIILGCTFAGNIATNVGGGLHIWGGIVTPTIERTIVWGNWAALQGSGILLRSVGDSVSFVCSLVDSSAIGGDGLATFVCDNLFVDPVFCSPAVCDTTADTTGVYSLNISSPALPSNNTCGNQMGALGVGCNPITNVWTGMGDGTSWEDPLNWTAGVPSVGTDVHIPDVAPTTEILYSVTSPAIGSIVCDEPFRISSGSLTVNGISVFSAAFTLEVGGALAGSGEVTLNAYSFWTGGEMTGTGSTVVTDTLEIAGSDSKSLRQGRSLEIFEVLVWGGTGDLEHGEGNLGTQLFNRSCGTIFITGPQFVDHLPAAGTPLLFQNDGLIVHDGTGTTTIEAKFQNTNGTLDLNSGLLDLTSVFLDFAGSTLLSGTYLLSDTLRFLGASIETNLADVVLEGPTAVILDDQAADALSGFMTNGPGASFSLLGGRSLTVGPGDFTNSSFFRVGAACSLLVSSGDYIQTAGETTLDTLDSVIEADDFDIQAGLVTGSGNLVVGAAVFVNSGTLEPGSSPGSLTISGDFVQTATGEIEIEIICDDGTASCQDILVIQGTATLGGALRVEALPGFEPSLGDTFIFINADAIVDSFDVLQAFSLETGQVLDPLKVGFRVNEKHPRFMGAMSSSWSDPSNWDPPRVPDPDEDVLVMQGVQISTPTTIRDLRVLGQTGSLEVSSSLTVNSVAMSDSGILVMNNSNATLQVEAVAGAVGLPAFWADDATNLSWSSGTIDVAGSNATFYVGGGGLSLGVSPLLTKLVVRDGAYAQVQGLLDIGGPEDSDRAEVRIEGASSRLEAGTVVVGLGGDGTLRLSGGGTLGGIGGASVNVTLGQVVSNAGNEGLLTGDGVIDGNVQVFYGGSVEPGTGIGTLSVTGSYSQNTGGTIVFELDDWASGQYDQIMIGGTATLGGILKIEELAGADPVGYQVIGYGQRAAGTRYNRPQGWALVYNEDHALVGHVGVIDTPSGFPHLFRVYQSFPNPFHSAASIRFDLPKPTPVTVRVLDIRGRLVRTLIDGATYSAGEHQTVWRGYDDHGREAAAGVYFYRLEAGAWKQVQRMVLLR